MSIELEREHKKACKEIGDETIRKIETQETPFLAVDIISGFPIGKACAIIDKMSPLGGALVYLIFLSQSKRAHQAIAKQIVTRAKKLELECTKGAVVAWEKTVRLVAKSC